VKIAKRRLRLRQGNAILNRWHDQLMMSEMEITGCRGDSHRLLIDVDGGHAESGFTETRTERGWRVCDGFVYARIRGICETLHVVPSSELAGSPADGDYERWGAEHPKWAVANLIEGGPHIWWEFTEGFPRFGDALAWASAHVLAEPELQPVAPVQEAKVVDVDFCACTNEELEQGKTCYMATCPNGGPSSG
jgi:hypothetical protein